jgi:hypothetical protein
MDKNVDLKACKGYLKDLEKCISQEVDKLKKAASNK